MATARAQGPRAAPTRPRLPRCRTGASSRLTLSPRPGTGVTSAGPGVHRHPGPEGLSLATRSVRGPCSDTEREPWRGPGMPGRCPGRAPVLKSKPRSHSATGAPPSERTPSGAESRPAPRLGGGSQRPLPSGCPEGRGRGSVSRTWVQNEPASRTAHGLTAAGAVRSCTRRSAGYRHAARATLSSRTRGAPRSRSRRARRQTRQGCGRTAGQT